MIIVDIYSLLIYKEYTVVCERSRVKCAKIYLLRHIYSYFTNFGNDFLTQFLPKSVCFVIFWTKNEQRRHLHNHKTIFFIMMTHKCHFVYFQQIRSDNCHHKINTYALKIKNIFNQTNI